MGKIKLENDNCKCENCTCKKDKDKALLNAKDLMKKKEKALQSGNVIQKTIMPNGNIHFSK